MKAKVLRFRLCAIAALLILGSNAQRAVGQSFEISPGTFSTTNVCQYSAAPAPGCQVLTNGSPNFPTIVSGGILQMNSANLNQHASAWYITPEPLASGFTTSFQFQITNTGACSGCSFPADGIALVIQNDPAGAGALGYTGNGQNIAYGNADQPSFNRPGEAILNSLAVELDSYENSDYGDPDNNHIAVQSCQSTAGALAGNSSDHTYLCPNGSPAKLALQSLIPLGLSLSDGGIHTITINYSAPGSCTSSCNNFTVYMDSTQVLQTTLNLATQLNLSSGSNAYIGLTASTGGSVENNNIISWSYSQWPLNPITIPQPLQPTVTNFSYTQTLSSTADYSKSGLPGSDFTGVVMQGSVTAISDSDFTNLVLNTPFQGSSCLHQDTSGNGAYSCVATTDLCTTPANPNPSGANCPNTGQNVTIGVTNTFNPDPSQQPFVAPGYLMGSDNALGCPTGSDNTCKGLINIFQGINGDLTTVNGKTNNFNSTLFPALGVVQPQTSVNTVPALNQGWTNQSVTVNFNSTEVVPANNTNPPSPLPTVANINYGVTGSDVPSPASGTITGATGSIVIPGTVAGTTTVTYYGTDTAGTVETLVTMNGNQVNSASPSLTIKTDLTPPTASCTANGPTSGWQAMDVTYGCTASDSGSGLANSSQASFMLSTAVPANTETSTASIAAVQIFDVAGNSSTVGPYGPFEVDKKAPVISGPSVSPASPTFGQSVTASYSCTDGGSGVTLCGPSGTPNIPPTANTGTLSSPANSSVGTYTFTVYSQDAVGNLSAPASVIYSVGKATPAVALGSAPNPSGLDQSVTFSAVVTSPAGTPTGSVTFSDGLVPLSTVPLAGSTATFSTAALALGIHSITASYNGDSNFLGVTSPVLSQVVTVAATTVTVVPSVNPAKVGQKVMLTAAVAGQNGGTPTGTITFYKGGSVLGTALLSGGQAGFSYTFNTAGTKSITAAYSGDANFMASSSAILYEGVGGDPTVTTMVSTPNPVPVGQTVTFTANVSSTFGSPTGTVTFIRNGVTDIGTVTLSGGQAILNYVFGTAGTKSITAVYSGDSTFAGNTSSVLTVIAMNGTGLPSTTTLSSSSNPSKAGKTVTLTAAVKSTQGSPTGTVTFKMDESTIIGTATVSNGQASLSFVFPEAAVEFLTAIYSGDSTFAPSVGALTQTVQ